jgi:hypothetical protein
MMDSNSINVDKTKNALNQRQKQNEFTSYNIIIPMGTPKH